MGLAEKHEWGYGEGCGFVSQTCDPNSHDEQCTDNYYNCSGDSQYVTQCYETLFSNKCRVKNIAKDCRVPRADGQTFETYSVNSQCHRFKNIYGLSAGCVETVCDYTTSTYKLIRKDEFYPFEFICRYKNEEHELPNWGVKLYCGDPSVVCKKKFQCPGNCNGRGVCLENGTCSCFAFYEGELCGRFKVCTQNQLPICNKLMDNNNIFETSMTNDYLAAKEIFDQAINNTLTSNGSIQNDTSTEIKINDNDIISGTSSNDSVTSNETNNSISENHTEHKKPEKNLKIFTTNILILFTLFLM